MIDFDAFERGLGDALRADADRGIRSFDPAAIARAAIATDRSRTRFGHARPERYGRTPRRTWMLVAATVAVGAAALGGALVGGLLTTPTPAPSFPGLVTDSSASPPPSETAPTATTLSAAQPAAAGQFDDLCDFGLGSDTVGWVSTKRALYRTEDLGTTWSAVQPPGWSAATAVDNLFIDADTAYSFLSGTPSKVAATHDGGATWVETDLGGNDAWPVFSFQAPSRGFLVFFGLLKTDPVSIYATIDGGLTWTGPQPATTIWGALMPAWCAHREPNGMLSQTHPWLGQALNGFVQLSRDGGLTWTKRPIPAGAEDPWEDGSGRLVVAAHPEFRPSRDEIYTSGDDGQSWQLAADLRPGGRDALFLSVSQWILMAGDGSSVASTVDGGAHWRTVVGASTFSIGLTSWASPDVAWVAALCGPYADPPTHPACDPAGVMPLLLQTTDGGRTWTTVGR